MGVSVEAHFNVSTWFNCHPSSFSWYSVCRSHGVSNCTLSLLSLAGPPMVSATGASDVLPEQIWGIPHSPPGPHSQLPSEVLPETQRAVLIPQPPALRSHVEPPQRTESQPTEASPIVYGLGPTPPCSLCDMERTKSHVPLLLDADVAGQSQECTLPLCRIKSKAGGPSIHEVGRKFMS